MDHHAHSPNHKSVQYGAMSHLGRDMRSLSALISYDSRFDLH